MAKQREYIHVFASFGPDAADSCGPLDIAADDDVTLLAWIRDQLSQGRLVEIWPGNLDPPPRP